MTTRTWTFVKDKNERRRLLYNQNIRLLVERLFLSSGEIPPVHVLHRIYDVLNVGETDRAKLLLEEWIEQLISYAKLTQVEAGEKNALKSTFIAIRNDPRTTREGLKSLIQLYEDCGYPVNY